eukprot:scaffold439369_cov39-Prasinocladus_malaysianus.AAC.1
MKHNKYRPGPDQQLSDEVLALRGDDGLIRDRQWHSQHILECFITPCTTERTGAKKQLISEDSKSPPVDLCPVAGAIDDLQKSSTQHQNQRA